MAASVSGTKPEKLQDEPMKAESPPIAAAESKANASASAMKIQVRFLFAQIFTFPVTGQQKSSMKFSSLF